MDRCFPARVLQVSHFAGDCHLTSVFIWERERETDRLNLSPIVQHIKHTAHLALIGSTDLSPELLGFSFEAVPVCAAFWDRALGAGVCSAVVHPGESDVIVAQRAIIGEAASGSKRPISRNWTRSVCTIAHFYCSNSCVSLVFWWHACSCVYGLLNSCSAHSIRWFEL